MSILFRCLIFVIVSMFLFGLYEIREISKRAEPDVVAIAARNKPDIIMLLADDLGFSDVPWHDEEVFAPNLQKLAEEGIILEQSYVQQSCTPTRSAIMSGIYPFATGRQSNVITSSQPTGLTLGVSLIPQYLKPLGYETHAIGKWHLGFCKLEYTPLERGFDTFTGYYTGYETYYTHNHANGYDFRDNARVYDEASGNYSTHIFASRVETILYAGDPEVPKFLYVAFQSVHDPLDVPDIYTKHYAHIQDKNRRTYLGMVTAMDEAIGRIVTALKETGRYNNSVIVFSTDNGGLENVGGYNWPLRGNKGTLWEGGTRGVALIHSLLLPNPGTVVNNLIHASDWLATFINIAGGIPPNGTDSISQWEALRGEAPPPRKELVYDIAAENFAIKAAIRVGDYKLVVGDPGPGEWIAPPLLTRNKTRKHHTIPTNKEVSYPSILSFNSSEDFFKLHIPLQLYDVSSDPEERTDLASSEKEITVSLLERLLSYKSRYVHQDNPHDDPKANPKSWDGVWSPGWC